MPTHPPARPPLLGILTAPAAAPPHLTPPLLRCGQVGQKRGREELEELTADMADGAKRKKIRLGFPASQWITVYNKHAPMKQR